MRPFYTSTKGRHRISRFPCMVFPYAPRSPTARGLDMSRVNDMPGVAFRLTHTVSTPELTCISRLNTWPARTPVNASAMALLPPPHDSGPMWLATPSSYDSLIHDTLPIIRRFRVRTCNPTNQDQKCRRRDCLSHPQATTPPGLITSYIIKPNPLTRFPYSFCPQTPPLPTPALPYI